MKANHLMNQKRAAMLGLVLLAGALPLRAQDALPVQESVFTAAVTTEQDGQAWAYVLWQSNQPDLLETKTYSVWRKAGDADANSPYTRAAVVGLQTDPLAVAALIDRAQLALGEDPEELNNTISNLFEDLVAGSIELPDKLAGVILGALGDDALVENLLLAARRHPALNMALGQAVALPIPSSGPVTIEVREHDPIADVDLGVVGRVTVDHDAPTFLPGPSVLGLTPKDPRDGFNNLNIKLLWDTPDDLRRVLLMTQGYNLYRVDKAFAESQSPDWSVTSPPAATLAAMATPPGGAVGRVNNAPITPDRMLDAADVAGADHTVSFFTDEETRFPGYPTTHTPPQNGDQYYYFVTVRDLLGDDGNSGTSPGVLGTFCDVMPPPLPRGLRVTNEFTHSGGLDQQFLRLHWRANDNSGDKKTTGYFIYRWDFSDQVYREGGNPLVRLVEGPIFPASGQTVMTWDDPGPYDASTGLVYDNTVWYTIRASDDGSLSPPGAAVCMEYPFGNLSGHTPPVPGVLRDRVGPEAPVATVLTWCMRPRIDPMEIVIRDEENIDPDQYTFRLRGERDRRDRQIVAVEFAWQGPDEQIQELGRVNFGPRGRLVSQELKIPRSADIKEVGLLLARSISRRGLKSAWSAQRPQLPSRFEVVEVSWFAYAEYSRHPYDELNREQDRDCSVHVIPPSWALPVDEDPGIEVSFTPTEGTRQFKLYYRIDNGPLTLAREQSGDFNILVALSVLLEVMPASAADVCLFLQTFDLNGNPSRMQRLACIPVEGTEPLPTPMLAPVVSSIDGMTPTATLTWFCPPHGLDRFRVWIASTPTPLPADASDLLYVDSSAPVPNEKQELIGTQLQTFDYRSYNTELIGPLFGNGAEFSLSFPVMMGSSMRVKVAGVTADGAVGPWSNAVDYTWTPDAGFTGPDVPWPARPMTSYAGATSFHPQLQTVYLPERQTAAVRIGRFEGGVEVLFDDKERTRIFWVFRDDQPEDLLFTGSYGSPTKERTVLPAILYRTQLADGTNYTEVPGDVVQVSPLMEHIITEQLSGSFRVHDPFIHIGVDPRDQRFWEVYLMDTQPQAVGASYTYLLVLFDPETMEPLQILPTGTITIP